MAKMVPDLSQQFLEELPMAFGIEDPQEKLSRADFELLFENESSIKLPVVNKKKTRLAGSQFDRMIMIKFLSEACEADDISPE